MLQLKKNAILVLEDGTAYRGSVFAGGGEVFGEAVFNTAMSGYQETLTDPSYKGQIVTMTYPLIGNYGINDEDMESTKIHMDGFIVKEYQPNYSNWRATESLKQFLEENGKIGIEGIDTRALTRKLRLFGAMKSVVSTETDDIGVLLEKLKAHPGLAGRDLVKEVTCTEAYLWKNGSPATFDNKAEKNKYRVAVLDCGVKYNILRCLEAKGCQVLVFPAHTKAEAIISCNPDGVLLSNGPGDPSALAYIVETVRHLVVRFPIFGICLGHQILGQALGGTTEKLKFGHRGINQPAKNLKDGRIVITSQNHGFVVAPQSLSADIMPTYSNLNDNTSEGMEFTDKNIFSVQYHPEAAPGPHDAEYLFDEFIALIAAQKRK